MKSLLNLVSVGCVLGVASIAVAGSVPLEPLIVMPGISVHGESTLFNPGGTDHINIDWIVMDAADAGLGSVGEFAYLFQIENNSASTDVEFMSINVKSYGFLSAGDLSIDLDLGVGSSGPHTPPGAETEGNFKDVGLIAVSTPVGINGTVSWTLPPMLLMPGDESQTLYFVHQYGPTYGHGGARDGGPPGPWDTQFNGSDLLPTPVPLPAAVWAALPLLGGLGVMKKFRKS